MQVGNFVNYDACCGDKIAYTHNGQEVQGEVISTYHNGIEFITTDGRQLWATYSQLKTAGATYTYIRPGNPLPVSPGLV